MAVDARFTRGRAPPRDRPARRHVRHVALIGGFLPRRCGIATYTTHIHDALRTGHPDVRLSVVAVDDVPGGHDYPASVTHRIPQHDRDAYRRLGETLDAQGVDVICLQHEYGIFGGRAGDYVLDLLDATAAPVVATLHTVLARPDAEQTRVLRRLGERAERLLVMNRRARTLLHRVYGVPLEKVLVVPHGVPDLPASEPDAHKAEVGLDGRFVLLTFGLLSPNKGIEHVIRALPHVVKDHPEILYVVVGATHPHVRRSHGEAYRESLKSLARRLGVADHVRFEDRFLPEDELYRYLLATDVYLTPYLHREQTSSGTLSYAVGAGRVVVSTPYHHAQELLAGGRGFLVPFRDPVSIARVLARVLDDEGLAAATRRRAHEAGRGMTWARVGESYLGAFEGAIAPEPTRPDADATATPDLAHLVALTDDVGLLQHAQYAAPDPQHGWTIDDNARGLLLASLLPPDAHHDDVDALTLAERYLGFLEDAFNGEAGRFRNVMAIDRTWVHRVGSEDAHGRAVWSLGVAARELKDAHLAARARRLLDDALPATFGFRSPRAWAFTLLGVDAALAVAPSHPLAREARDVLGRRLHQAYRRYRQPEWPWFEDVVSYDNARLPQALLLAGHGLGDRAMVRDALEALRWLCDAQKGDNGVFRPIGCHGFWTRGGEPATWDQQPVEAQATVDACLDAHRITGEARWWREADGAHRWFLGANDVGVPVHDPVTGGCHDGLTPTGVNGNQGAESTLAWLLSTVAMARARRPVAPTLAQAGRAAPARHGHAGGGPSARAQGGAGT